jgi:hypothetical protein
VKKDYSINPVHFVFFYHRPDRGSSAFKDFL